MKLHLPSEKRPSHTSALILHRERLHANVLVQQLVTQQQSSWGRTPLSLQYIHTCSGPLTQIATRLLSWWTGARSSSSSMCTLAWKTYQFTQLAPRPEKAILLGVPEARSTHTVRISQLFDYSGKSLWKIDSVNARPVAGPVSITITSVSR